MEGTYLAAALYHLRQHGRSAWLMAALLALMPVALLMAVALVGGSSHGLPLSVPS